MLAALYLAMFWTPVTGGCVLSGVPAVFADQPFKGYAPHDLHAFYNPWLADNAREYVSWQGLARSSLRRFTYDGDQEVALRASAAPALRRKYSSVRQSRRSLVV